MRNIFFSLSLFLSMVVCQNTGYSNPVENEQENVEETHQVIIRHCDKRDKLTECIITNGYGVRPLIETGANVNFQNYKHTRLMGVIYHSLTGQTVKILPQLDDNTEIVKILLEDGADVIINHQDTDNNNRTFYYEVDTETLEILLEDGADVIINHRDTR